MKFRWIAAFLIAALGGATLLTVESPSPVVGQGILARSVTLPETKTMVFRNKSGSVLMQYEEVETDTAWVRLTGSATGSAKHALILPDTFTVDSLTVSPNDEGGPFKLLFSYSGSISADTIFITGLGNLNPVQVPLSYTTALIETLVASGQNQLTRATYDSVSQIHTPTSGADSVVISYVPLFGVADADSNESRFNFVGVVVSDSIPDDSLGIVAVDGPVVAKLNGNTTRINQWDFLTCGTSGFVKWSAAAGDTLWRAGITGPNADSLFAGSNSTIVARSLSTVTTTQDSAWILLKSVW